MSSTGFPLATTSWDNKEYAAIDRVVASGMFSMGAEVAQFEEQFAKAMGSQHCVMVNSGSSANLIIIAALRYHSTHGMMPQTCYAPRYGCYYGGNRLMHRHQIVHMKRNARIVK